jgi:hypothetical protein
MKIIHRGKFPKNPAPQWWTIPTLECNRCDTTIQLEASDNPRVGFTSASLKHRWVQIACPICDRMIEYVEPALGESF